MEKFRPYALPNAKWLSEVKEKLTAKCEASGVKPGEAPPDPAEALAADEANKPKPPPADDLDDDLDSDDDKDAA